MQAACLEIPPDPGFIKPATVFLRSVVNVLGGGATSVARLDAALDQALQWVIRKNGAGKSEEPIRIDCCERQGKLRVEIHNRGVPIFAHDGDSASHVGEVVKHLDRFSIVNEGRGGQALVLELGLSTSNVARDLVTAPSSATVLASDEIVIGPASPSDAEEISRLFHLAYGYNYVHEFVYYPEKLRSMLEEGDLTSVVATLPDGRVVGHVGVYRWSSEPRVYECRFGVVDPSVAGRGLFKGLFAQVMLQVAQMPMQYCFFDCVTNLDFTQRLIAQHGAHDVALFLGCQSSATQARLSKLGIGADLQGMDRYSLLYALLPRVAQPFGASVELPSGLGEMLGFLLTPLGLTWNPSPRFDALADDGSFHSNYDSPQKAVTFYMTTVGRAALRRVASEWRELLRHGYQYAAVDIPLGQAGLAQAYDLLAREGFFVAGFLPYRNLAQLCLRLQAIAPAEVAFDQIRVHSPTAKALLRIVREDYERNRLL